MHLVVGFLVLSYRIFLLFSFFFFFGELSFLGAAIWRAERETRVLPTSVPKKVSIIGSIIRVCRISRYGF